MKRVLVIISNPEQASFRVRIGALVQPLAQRRIELDVRVRPRGWLSRRRLLASAGEYDAVLLQRKLLDPSDTRLLGRAARCIYYDVDDAVMHYPGRSGWVSPWRTRRRFRATVEAVDHVVAGNAYLAGIFRAHGKEVTILPTCIDHAAYPIKQHEPTQAPRLVWIGSSSTLPYLRESVPALEEAAKRVPRLRLLIIADRSIGDARLPIEFQPWSQRTEAELLCRGDIGIAPTPDNLWTRGKCGFKIVQYMAAGLPVIASPVGANAELVVPGETGLLATGPQQWVEAVVKLAEDQTLRAGMGAAGRRRVEQHYSINRALETWSRLLLDRSTAAD